MAVVSHHSVHSLNQDHEPKNKTKRSISPPLRPQ
nr:MAG TPA: hypothetical protein [Caudoviricetes sp.]